MESSKDNDDVARRLQGYQDLRSRLNLPPIADDGQLRQSLSASEGRKEADDARRKGQEQQRKEYQAAWEHRVLAAHDDVTIVARKGEAFCQSGEGEPMLLVPPCLPCDLNDVFDLNAVPAPVVDGQGYAWTRAPVIAFFSDDGTRLTVQWVACAHEAKYGWEFSHAIVQRVTWGRAMVDGKSLWTWMESIQRPGLAWGTSTEPWTSLCRP